MSKISNKVAMRQAVLALSITLSLAEFVENDNEIEIQLPIDAEVVGGDVVVETVFDTTGTDTIKLGDSADDDEYLSAVNIKAAARTALTLTGIRCTNALRTLKLVRTPADTDATEGQLKLTILYVETDKAGEFQQF
ncbi:MAG: hypothetical protein AB7V08_13855 [Elusimicrobiales bacterium]